jgi:large subunit ribosomal protein L19
MANLVDFVNNGYKKRFPVFRAGDTITVYYKIKEGEKLELSFLKGCNPKRRYWKY